jgi:hypothetical protein
MAAGESLGLEGVVERGMEINPQTDADGRKEIWNWRVSEGMRTGGF